MLTDELRELENTVDVIRLSPQERISERIVDQVVDVPVPQFPNSVVCITSPVLRTS